MQNKKMYFQELRILELRLLEFLSLPVVGRILQKKSVTVLATITSVNSVKALAKVVTRHKDNELKYIALNALNKIEDRDCVDAVCKIWQVTRDPDLSNLLIKKHWVASAPANTRVLSALKTEQLQIVIQEGKEVVSPLLNAFLDEDFEIARNARECAVNLINPDAIDVVCQEWIKTREAYLEQIVCQGKYIAHQPVEVRVLTALKVGNFEAIKHCGTEIVTPLLNALRRDKDLEIVDNAKKCTLLLTNSDAIDKICQDWMSTRDIALEQLISQAKYVALRPIKVRVLTALKIGNFESIKHCGREIVTPLLNALRKDKDLEIVENARKCTLLLTSSDAIDIICQDWVSTRDKTLERTITQAKYVALRTIKARVLTALKIANFEVIKNSQSDTIETLIEAFEDKDSEIALNARKCAKFLTNPQCLDLICQTWANSRAIYLEDLVCQKKYVAQQPVDVRVLTALKLGDFEAIKNGEKEIIDPKFTTPTIREDGSVIKSNSKT